MLITLIYSHLFYYKSSHVLCPLNFILLFLYFSLIFLSLRDKMIEENSCFQENCEPDFQFLQSLIDLQSNPFKSQKKKKRRSPTTSLEQKLPPWDTPFPLFIPTRAGSTREQDRTRQRNNPTVFSAFPISSGFLPSLPFLSFSFSQRVANKQTIPWMLKDEMENGDGGKRWEGKDERKR